VAGLAAARLASECSFHMQPEALAAQREVSVGRQGDLVDRLRIELAAEKLPIRFTAFGLGAAERPLFGARYVTVSLPSTVKVKSRLH
jgi:hypothetical protein